MSEPKLSAPISDCHNFFTPHQASPERVAKAQRLFDERSAREKLFTKTFFGEPAWDLLLCLYIADSCVCTSDLPRRLQMPHSVIARWLTALEREGLICRLTHPDHSLVVAVDLTQEAYIRMDNYFDLQVA